MGLRFKKSDFDDIWDHRLACFIPPNLVKEVVKRANEMVKNWNSWENEKTVKINKRGRKHTK